MKTKKYVQHHPTSETELRAPVERLFPKKQYISKCEVPFGLKKIDLLFKERESGNTLTAVELKLRNWKRALWQAVHNRQIAKYSYVAVPGRCASCVDRALLGSLRVGLIAVEAGRARFLLRPDESPYVDRKTAHLISKEIGQG